MVVALVGCRRTRWVNGDRFVPLINGLVDKFPLNEMWTILLQSPVLLERVEQRFQLLQLVSLDSRMDFDLKIFKKLNQGRCYLEFISIFTGFDLSLMWSRAELWRVASQMNEKFIKFFKKKQTFHFATNNKSRRIPHRKPRKIFLQLLRPLVMDRVTQWPMIQFS